MDEKLSIAWLLAFAISITSACSENAAGPTSPNGRIVPQPQAEAVRVDGNMYVRWPLGSGRTNLLEFSCIVQPDGWRLVLRENGKLECFGHRELASNGTNLFSVEYVSAPGKLDGVSANGSVQPYPSNAIPVSLSDFSHVLWLAYCRALPKSADFHGANISMRLLSGMGQVPVLGALTCVAAWHPNDPQALSRLDIFNPGVIYGSSGQQYSLPPPYDRGYCTARFIASGFTNLAGGCYPKTASWRIFLPPEHGGADTNDLVVSTDVFIQATNIAVAPVVPDIRPQVATLMYVGDYRLKTLLNADGGYVTKEGWSTQAEAMRPSLVGRALPALATVNLPNDALVRGKPLLLCLFDCEQRPSRQMLRLLSDQSETLSQNRVTVLGLQAVVVTSDSFERWSTANPLPFRTGRIVDKTPASRWATETGSLPWLILVNSQGIVAAEGFPLELLVDKVHDLGQ